MLLGSSDGNAMLSWVKEHWLSWDQDVTVTPPALLTRPGFCNVIWDGFFLRDWGKNASVTTGTASPRKQTWSTFILRRYTWKSFTCRVKDPNDSLKIQVSSNLQPGKKNERGTDLRRDGCDWWLGKLVLSRRSVAVVSQEQVSFHLLFSRLASFPRAVRIPSANERKHLRLSFICLVPGTCTWYQVRYVCVPNPSYKRMMMWPRQTSGALVMSCQDVLLSRRPQTF